MNESKDILDKLHFYADRWHYAQPDLYAVLKDAIYEIRLLRETQKVRDENNRTNS